MKYLTLNLLNAQLCYSAAMPYSAVQVVLFRTPSLKTAVMEQLRYGQLNNDLELATELCKTEGSCRYSS